MCGACHPYNCKALLYSLCINIDTPYLVFTKLYCTSDVWLCVKNWEKAQVTSQFWINDHAIEKLTKYIIGISDFSLTCLFLSVLRYIRCSLSFDDQTDDDESKCVFRCALTAVNDPVNCIPDKGTTATGTTLSVWGLWMNSKPLNGKHNWLTAVPSTVSVNDSWVRLPWLVHRLIKFSSLNLHR